MDENHDTFKHLFWLHTCRVYPFNLDAIDCGIDFECRASHNEHSDDNDKDNSCGFDDSNDSDDQRHDDFSAETLARFQKTTRGMICRIHEMA